MNLMKEVARLQKRMDRWITGWRTPRMWLAHPDVCLYLRPEPRFGWRYLIKIGATRGHLVVWFGWLGATVRW